MKWCTRNSDEVVTEVIDIDPAGRYHPDWVWYECPDTTVTGMVWDGTEYVDDPYYFMTDVEVANRRYADNARHAEELMSTAESNPSQGVILDTYATAKSNKRRNNRAKGKNKINNKDDALSTHIDDVMDSLDLADDAVEGNTRQENIDWLPTNVTWPLWTAPA